MKQLSTKQFIHAIFLLKQQNIQIPGFSLQGNTWFIEQKIVDTDNFNIKDENLVAYYMGLLLTEAGWNREYKGSIWYWEKPGTEHFAGRESEPKAAYIAFCKINGENPK